MTTLVVLQPGYLPWLGFFDQLARSDVFVCYDDVQYDKHGWRNRNRIKTPNGPLWLTVPVLVGNHFGQRNLEVAIDSRQPWARKHLASIRQYYAKAPFLAQCLPELTELYQYPWQNLVELDLATIEWLALRLGIRKRIERSSRLGIQEERNLRLLRLCQHFGVDVYLSGNSAKDYLDIPLFERHHIQVIWQDFQHPTYPQLHGYFVPYLSALDLVLNHGEASHRYLTIPQAEGSQ